MSSPKYKGSGVCTLPKFLPLKRCNLRISRLFGETRNSAFIDFTKFLVIPFFRSGGAQTCFENATISLIGFSKGCVVLNQFLHEFHFAENSKSQPMAKIISRISAMYFIDGGHAGKKNTWITNQTLLESLSKLGTCFRLSYLKWNIFFVCRSLKC